MAIANLRVPISALPKADLSWLDSLAQAGGDVMSELGARKSFGTLADKISAGAPQAGGFFNQLTTGQQPVQQAQQVQPAMTAAVGRVDRGPAQGSTFEPFINTVRAGGVTNPNALAAIAATGKAESGWSPANANRSWSDPSVSGQPGTAGGVMSWRAERLQNLYNFARQKGEAPGNISPETQAEFFLREDPQLITRLNQAKSPQEAADIMAGAWRFAGYDQQGGEAARRRALTQNYYSQFAGGEQGDTSGTETAYVDPTVVNAGNIPARSGAPLQTADSSGSIIAPGITPVQRGGVDPSIIQFMLRDPNLRETGLKLWAANAEGQKPTEPWQFVTLPDGTLARANQQTGEVTRLGNFAKPDNETVVVGEDLVRRSDGSVVYKGQPKNPASWNEYQMAKQDGFQGSYADWEKVKVPGTSVTVNNGEGDKFYENLDKKNAETFSAMSDAGIQARGKLAQIDRLETLLTEAPQGAEGVIKQWLGDLGVATEGLDSIQATRALLEKMVPEQRPPGSGPMSDADIVMFRNSLPRVVNQPGGNQLILQTMRGIANYEMEMGRIADMVADRAITPAEGRKMVRELENPLARYREAVKDSGAAGGTQGGPARPMTDEDYNALPSGALFIDPDDGKTYRKP